MFFRVRAGDGQRAGTGLGLAICKGIVDAHGGSIRAGSAKPDGTGTRIAIRLPLAPWSAGMSAIARILVVDDENQIRRFLRVALEAHGYEVVEAATGAEAVRMAATEEPDLIVLDLGLPDMDGKAVIARVREWSQVPDPGPVGASGGSREGRGA